MSIAVVISGVLRYSAARVREFAFPSVYAFRHPRVRRLLSQRPRGDLSVNWPCARVHDKLTTTAVGGGRPDIRAAAHNIRVSIYVCIYVHIRIHI